MKLLLIVFALAVVTVSAHPPHPKCKALKNAENINLPELTWDDLGNIKRGVELNTVADLEGAIRDHRSLMVFTTFYHETDECRSEVKQFFGLMYREAVKDNNMWVALVKCPSEVCTHLKVASFVDFTFYHNGVSQGQLNDSLEESEFLDKVNAITKED